jgi:hypothetical protein
MDHVSIVAKARLEVHQKMMSSVLLANDELIFALAKRLSQTPLLNYEAFKKEKFSAPEQLQKYFTPRNFLVLKHNKNLEIEAEDFLRFVVRLHLSLP